MLRKSTYSVKIYHIGIFVLYHCGIIMSRGDDLRLREIRKNKGLSQLKLAMELNTNQNTISRYENGEREPGINELIKIADRQVLFMTITKYLPLP